MTAARVNSSWETDTLEHRLMMRLSVMAAGLLILLPALFTFSASPLTLVTLLTYPGLIITDHGHFQYNNISLGIALMAGSKVNSGRCPGPELQAARRIWSSWCTRSMTRRSTRSWPHNCNAQQSEVRVGIIKDNLQMQVQGVLFASYLQTLLLQCINAACKQVMYLYLQTCRIKV